MNNNFPNNLTYIISNKILTTNDILKITNHSSTGLISMWKSGERQPLVKDVMLIANKLNVSMDDLICKDISEVLKNNNNELINKIDMLDEKDQQIVIDMVNRLRGDDNE